MELIEQDCNESAQLGKEAGVALPDTEIRPAGPPSEKAVSWAIPGATEAVCNDGFERIEINFWVAGINYYERVKSITIWNVSILTQGAGDVKGFISDGEIEKACANYY